MVLSSTGKNFFADELAFLQDHLEAVQSRLLQAKAPPQDQNYDLADVPAGLFFVGVTHGKNPAAKQRRSRGYPVENIWRKKPFPR